MDHFMSSVQGMIGKMGGGSSSGGMPDIGQMMSTFAPMMAGMMSSGGGGMPDIGQMMNKMTLEEEKE